MNINKDTISQIYNINIEQMDIAYKSFLHTHFILKTKNEKFFLKIYSYNKDNINILNRLLALYDILLGKELNVPIIISTRNNRKYYIYNHIIFVLFSYIEHEPIELTSKTICTLGKEIAYLHKSLKKLASEHLTQISYDKSLRIIKEKFQIFLDNYIENKPTPLEISIYELIKYRMSLFDILQKNIMNNHTMQIIHGDLNIKNILSHDNIFWFVDFDNHRIDTPARDIACFLVSIFTITQSDPTIYLQFIQSYSSINSLSLKDVYFFMIFEVLNIISLFLEKIKIYLRIQQHQFIIKNCLDCLEYLMKNTSEVLFYAVK